MVNVVSMCGSQGTGKTFTANKLYTMLKTDYKILKGYDTDRKGNGKSISRIIKDKGFPINENTTFETQYLIMLYYLKEDIETRKNAEINGYDFVIYDRSPFDQLAYTKLAYNNDKITNEELQNIYDITNNHMKEYPLDFCFVLSPLSDIELYNDSDGYRSTSNSFQAQIDNGINSLFVDDHFIVNKEEYGDRLVFIREIKDLEKRSVIPYEVINKFK